jgi:hypothetical protein
MTTMTGGCLCGQIRFEVDGPVAGIGVCHCSLCRKITGNNGAMIFVVPARRFRWTSGREHVVAWFLRPGVRTMRCDVCGCPTPASHDGDKHMWVQPGLIDGDIDAQVAVHIFASSRANWDQIPQDALQYDGFPPPEIRFAGAAL